MIKPGVLVGTRINDRAFDPPDRSVRHRVTIVSAMLALVHHILLPLMIHSSPSSLARVCTPPDRSLPCARFGQRQCGELARSGGERRQEFLFQFFGAEQSDRRAAQPVVRGDGEAGRSAAAPDLFDRHRRADRIDACAAVLLRHVEAQQADRPHLLDGRPVELGGFIGMAGARL